MSSSFSSWCHTIVTHSDAEFLQKDRVRQHLSRNTAICLLLTQEAHQLISRFSLLQLLNAIQLFGANLDDYLHLLLPPIVKLFDAPDVPLQARKSVPLLFLFLFLMWSMYQGDCVSGGRACRQVISVPRSNLGSYSETLN